MSLGGSKSLERFQKKVKILDFLNFGQRCLGSFWLIGKLFLLAQIDVWMALGLSTVDLGQLIALEASPKANSGKVGKSILRSLY